MSISRIYQQVELAPNQLIRLDEKASHHLNHVIHSHIGDPITLFNGSGGEYKAVITRIDKKSIEVNITSFVDRDVESPIRIYLAQGMARGEKMDFIVQKATELGVHTIIPLITERCNVKLDKEREEKKVRHWQSVAQSSCEQCGRNQLPNITSPSFFEKWLTIVKADQCFVLSPHVVNKLPALTFTKHASIVLLIGPEGGLSEAEINMAIDKGFIALNVGPRILRTETAPIAAITILQHRYGDL